jgi:hypothetical protein
MPVSTEDSSINPMARILTVEALVKDFFRQLCMKVANIGLIDTVGIATEGVIKCSRSDKRGRGSERVGEG